MRNHSLPRAGIVIPAVPVKGQIPNQFLILVTSGPLTASVRTALCCWSYFTTYLLNPQPGGFLLIGYPVDRDRFPTGTGIALLDSVWLAVAILAYLLT